MKRPSVHFTAGYLLNPQHEITISLVGCGGTGSQVLSCLGRMNAALKALGHPGMHVTAYDSDVVTRSNLGRQLFCESDIGMNKANCIVTRINRFLALGWDAVGEAYAGQPANIVISCTDTVASRLTVGQAMCRQAESHTPPYLQRYYWLDLGNGRQTGQAVLGSVPILQPVSKKYRTVEKLKFVTELCDYANIRDTDSGPSCSLSDALARQDLFINSILAQLGTHLLWQLFREGRLSYHGLFLNLSTMQTNPVPLVSENQ